MVWVGKTVHTLRLLLLKWLQEQIKETELVCNTANYNFLIKESYLFNQGPGETLGDNLLALLQMNSNALCYVLNVYYILLVNNNYYPDK
jgi:hypothetical protein